MRQSTNVAQPFVDVVLVKERLYRVANVQYKACAKHGSSQQITEKMNTCSNGCVGRKVVTLERDRCVQTRSTSFRSRMAVCLSDGRVFARRGPAKNLETDHLSAGHVGKTIRV